MPRAAERRILPQKMRGRVLPGDPVEAAGAQEFGHARGGREVVEAREVEKAILGVLDCAIEGGVGIGHFAVRKVAIRIAFTTLPPASW